MGDTHLLWKEQAQRLILEDWSRHRSRIRLELAKMNSLHKPGHAVVRQIFSRSIVSTDVGPLRSLAPRLLVLVRVGSYLRNLHLLRLAVRSHL
jgi:hypothetical protein